MSSFSDFSFSFAKMTKENMTVHRTGRIDLKYRHSCQWYCKLCMSKNHIKVCFTYGTVPFRAKIYRLVVAPKVICEILGLISQILMGLGQNVLFRRRKIWTRVVAKNNPLFTNFYSPAVL